MKNRLKQDIEEIKNKDDNYEFGNAEGRLEGYELAEKEIMKKVIKLLKNKDYICCKFCKTIAYGDGKCSCRKSFKTDENWIFAIDLFKEELKKEMIEYEK